MRVTPLPLQDAFIIKEEPHEDQRGMFSRLYCCDEFKRLGIHHQIAQINYSRTSKKGTIRGLHFQHPPYSEIKIIHCLKGKVFDVIVDLRQDSPTFLQWHGEILSQEDFQQVFIPAGFAHGFQTLENDSELLYLHDEFYHPQAEGGVHYKEPRVGIEWPIPIAEISTKDEQISYLPSDFRGLVS